MDLSALGVVNRSKRYHALDLDGICMVGEPLENGSIMVNKESPTSVAELDGGGAWRERWSGVVDVRLRPTLPPLSIPYSGSVSMLVGDGCL